MALIIDTIPGFDGGLSFQFGKPTPDHAAGTDPAAWCDRIANQIAAGQQVDAQWTEAFLRSLSARIHAPAPAAA